MDEFKRLKQRLIDSLIRNFEKKGENLTYTDFKTVDEDSVIGYRPEHLKIRDKRNKDNFKGFIRRKFK